MFNRWNKNLNSKVDTNIYLVIILLLTVVICALEHRLIIPALLLLGGIYYFAKRNLENKDITFSSYMDNIIRNIERTNHFAVRKLDIGMAVFSKEGKLQWSNPLFKEWVGEKHPEGKRPEEILKQEKLTFDNMKLKDGSRTIQMEGRYYKLQYFSVQTQDKPANRNDATNSGLMIYLTDITDYELLQQEHENNKLCLAYARFDNYEDVMRGLSESSMASLNGEVNELLTKWTEEQQGFVCRMNKETSLVGMSQAMVANVIDNKFQILDKVREIRVGNKISPTVSIGVACSGNNLQELIANAKRASDMALERGGDQAVVLKDGKMEFFGGTSTVAAKSTRVRARIMARSIHELMQKADHIFVMGHTNEDFDAIGSAVGIAKLALSLNKVTHIVISGQNNSIEKISAVLNNPKMRTLASDPVYTDIMVSGEEALKMVTPKSLLFVMDHHRRVLSASKELLDAVTNRVIIDHHRHAKDLIDQRSLLYLEATSSSTSELVTELAGYFDDRLVFSAGEATVLYAGIVLDTKNFVVQTGERTFEAAALLLRSGASPAMVREVFKDDMRSVQQRSRLIAEAKVPLEGMAVSVLRNVNKDDKASILAAQTADALITITGISVGYAIVEYKDGSIGISARSDGSVNVSTIMEDDALKGGGHQTVAGAQLANKHARDVEPLLVALTAKQFEEKAKKEEAANKALEVKIAEESAKKEEPQAPEAKPEVQVVKALPAPKAEAQKTKQADETAPKAGEQAQEIKN